MPQPDEALAEKLAEIAADEEIGVRTQVILLDAAKRLREGEQQREVDDYRLAAFVLRMLWLETLVREEGAVVLQWDEQDGFWLAPFEYSRARWDDPEEPHQTLSDAIDGARAEIMEVDADAPPETIDLMEALKKSLAASTTDEAGKEG